MSSLKKANIAQVTLDFSKPVEPHMGWPPNSRFPLNRRASLGNTTLLEEIVRDINESSHYLVVTGFTSLAHIIEFFGKHIDYTNTLEVKIVLGFEPERKARKNWAKVELAKEIKDYWLENDYSILHSGEVIRIIDLVQKDIIKFRILDRLHAKMYVGRTHAILGSANFSKNGTTTQLEANIRVPNDITNTTLLQQYEEIKLIATNYYQLAKDYKEGIIDLLKGLLKIVSWQEALARAIVELVDRNWFKDLPDLYTRLNAINLWPSQRMGLAEALYILQTQGCVLVADPTGSGKTKLISTLQLVLFHWLWETGRKAKSYATTICPPLVQSNWRQEFLDIQFSQISQVSMGILSNTNSSNHKNAIRQIKLSNILVIDEAHNYLSDDSNRSNSLSEHTADNIILSTATPINKKSKDLIRLIEILGADSLNDKELEQFKILKGLRSIKKQQDLQLLRDYIKKFIVRRTKSQLNKLIDKNQTAYTNKQGEPCRYPKNKSLTYSTGESHTDMMLAKDINELAKQLKGIIYLQDLSRSDYDTVYDDGTYVERRLKAASALSVFNVQARMRSSRAALIEHIEGTKLATDHFKFKTSKNDSGNIIGKIKKMKIKLPARDIEDIYFPHWLTNLTVYQQECNKEIELYAKITALTKQMSDSRETQKVEQIIKLFSKHKLVLAFDSTIITLDYLNSLIKTRYAENGIETYVVTGSTSKTKVLEKFDLGSSAANVLALCSDSISEGVNLQQASVLVLLDMPSVLRIAEQRIGRIDRLDSPHKEIEVYWPNDTDQFALKTDLKLIKTSVDTDTLIGSNFKIPPEILDKHLESIVKPDQMIDALKEFENTDVLWEGMQDAFRPVHDLYDGSNAILKMEDYEYLKDIDATVKVKLSICSSKKPWLFLALRGTKSNSPRWYYIDENDKIYLELSEICQQLRKSLSEVEIREETWSEHTKLSLNKYVALLQQNEINILPNKRKRALEVAQFILTKQKDLEAKSKDKKRLQLITQLLGYFKPSTIDDELSLDYYMFSQQWLDILNPYLYEKKKSNKRRKNVITLNTLKKDFKNIHLSIPVLQNIIDNAPFATQTWSRVAACIIGIPK